MKRRMILFITAIFALSIFAYAGTEGKKTVDINVEGMTCGACVNKVKGALEKVDGVKEANVNLEKNNAVIVYDAKKTNEKALHKVINSTGFKATDGGDKKACPAGCTGECCASKDTDKTT